MASMLFNASGVRASASGQPTAPTGVHPLKLETEHINIDAIRAKYDEEREKRNRKEGIAQFKHPRGASSRFSNDIFTPPASPRDPIRTETKVLIVGAGFAGMTTAVKLKKEQGIDDFVIVDKAGGFGGTWYWNQYPGVACDVESYIYLPFLEETGYLPQDRFAYGPEIRDHMKRVVSKWDLERHAYLQTEITSMKWDGSIRRWHVGTNHADHFVAQFVVLATGTFHEPKLPALRGVEDFARPQFHSCRWDYGLTGGTPDKWEMTKLADKTVGVIGTGCSAVQLLPQLARWAKKVYVFQRTPSSISLRENYKTKDDPEVINGSLTKGQGWQLSRMEDFANILQGTVLDRDCAALEGLEALTARSLFKEAAAAGVTIQLEDIPELLQLSDVRLMEKIRTIIEETVEDRQTAEKLKPWYPFMCKRPAFHNDYLAAFNSPNVELVDTDGQGVSHLTKTAVVANGKEHEVDLLIYSTGFDYETDADFYRRTGIELIGAKGKTLDETWEEHKGPLTLFGVHFIDFPNLFNIGPSQAGVTANWTHTAYVAGEHISKVIADILRRHDEFQAIVPTEEAAESWGKQVDEGAEMRLQFNQACPPGYYNRQGKPEDVPSRMAYYPKGIMEWQNVMRTWREEGSFGGMEKL